MSDAEIQKAVNLIIVS